MNNNNMDISKLMTALSNMDKKDLELLKFLSILTIDCSKGTL